MMVTRPSALVAAATARGGAVRVERVGCPAILPAVVDVAHSELAVRRQPLETSLRELDPALAVGDGDRQARPLHAGKQHRARRLDLDGDLARLELLAAVAGEARPAVAAGDQPGEMGEHLAAVADPEGHRAGALEEGGEHVAERLVEQDGARPPGAGSEHVAVAEAPAGGQGLEPGEVGAAVDQVGHGDVDRLEPGRVEGGGHLDLAVYALLAEDGGARSGQDGPGQSGFGFVRGRRGGVESHRVARPRVGEVGVEVPLLFGAVRVVAQGLHAEGQLGPGGLQL